jgi:outer membrane lipase/esterase
MRVLRSLWALAGARSLAFGLFFGFAAFTSSAVAQTPRCPNQIAIERASDNAASNSAVADPTCTANTGDTGTGNTGAAGNDNTRQSQPDSIQQAAKTAGSSPGVAVVTTTGFAGALLNHLDALRGQAATAGIFVTGATDGLMGLGANSKIRPQQPAPVSLPSPFTLYAMGTVGGGHRSEMPDVLGLNYESTSGILGIEYRVNSNLIVGLAGNYTVADASLTNNASVDVQAVQAAAYMSYSTKVWFIDALIGYGRHDLDMVRPDSGQQLRASTDGKVFAAAVRGAYLFDLGGVRAGPLAGITFARSRIGGFTETGDPQLALTVASQTVDTATASVGVRFLAPFVTSGTVVVPYLNVSLEHELGERARTLSASFALQPQQPVFSSVPNFHTPTYGKIEGGVTLQLDDSLSATLGAASTFAREEGYDYRVSAGLSYKF